VEGPDAGIYDGMNRGLAASTGRYVWFVNSGDVLHDPGVVAAAMSRVSARAADWYYGAVVPVDGEGRRAGPTLLPTLTARGLRWGDVYASHQGMLMSRDLLIRLDGFDAGYASAGEFHLYLRAIRLGEPVRIDAELVDFLVGGRSTTGLSEHLREMSRARTDVLRPALPGRVLNRGLTGYRTWRGTTGLRSLPGVHSLRQRYLVIRHGSPGP
jgi:putative colanic acid biosynthesis glycosyltransferase